MGRACKAAVSSAPGAKETRGSTLERGLSDLSSLCLHPSCTPITVGTFLVSGPGSILACAPDPHTLSGQRWRRGRETPSGRAVAQRVRRQEASGTAVAARHSKMEPLQKFPEPRSTHARASLPTSPHWPPSIPLLCLRLFSTRKASHAAFFLFTSQLQSHCRQRPSCVPHLKAGTPFPCSLHHS